jgi:hypothetical protein
METTFFTAVKNVLERPIPIAECPQFAKCDRVANGGETQRSVLKAIDRKQ